MDAIKKADEEILAHLRERYPGKDNYHRDKSEYFQRLLKMSQDELKAETKQKIWLSAFASNNPRSDYHWQVDAIYDVYHLRGQDDGYKQAYREVYIGEFGKDPYPDMG